jgi:hypothetical protein
VNNVVNRRSVVNIGMFTNDNAITLITTFNTKQTVNGNTYSFIYLVFICIDFGWTHLQPKVGHTFFAVANVISGNVIAPAARNNNKNTTHVNICASVIIFGYLNSYVVNIFLLLIY